MIARKKFNMANNLPVHRSMCENAKATRVDSDTRRGSAAEEWARILDIKSIIQTKVEMTP
jgi:hypothetical protein